jgi:6-phosphofructokinase 2
VPPILTITLNPALDLTTSVGKLEPGGKMRCAVPRYDPGGGGINVSRIIAELGGESLAFVGLAGHTGRLMREMVENAGIATEAFELRGETRITLQVVERSSDDQYRFVLPGPQQDASVEERLLAALDECIDRGQFRYVVASGSLPPGLSDGFYGRLAGHVNDAGGRLILDTSGPALHSALGKSLYLVKPDRQEAESLLLETKAAEDAGVEDLAGSLLACNAAEAVIVTLGSKGAVLASAEGQVRFRSPQVAVRSMTGAGDSFVGALCWALASDWPLVEACRYGVAAAAAAVTTEATELAHRQDVQALYQRMKDAGD